MTEASDAVAELAALIERVSGNVVPPGHHRFLAVTARERAASLRIGGVAEYVRALAEGDLPGEWSCLLPHVTIKESFLFRHPQQFEALARTVLPRLAAARGRDRTLRVWSAGCARGEEPATLAIVLAECPEIAGREWRILATDVDERALAAARTGAFGARAVAGVPEALRSRYLAKRGDVHQLSGELARRIEYVALNLVSEPLLPNADPFDLIFLRNVLIYFRPESQRRVAAAVARALAPDGVLFLGPAETLWQLSDAVEALDLGECFCYRRAGGPVAGQGSVDLGTRQPAAEPGARPTAGTARAHGAHAPAGRAAQARPPQGPPARATDRGPRITPSGLQGTRERLAEAVRSISENRPERAAELVGQALLADPSDPATHALEGVLHEACGRTQTAVASYRAALFLDAALFQVRLLLADALRRLGHHQRAALEYREVMAALAAGTARALDSLAGLPIPGGDEAGRRCREALLGLPAHPALR